MVGFFKKGEGTFYPQGFKDLGWGGYGTLAAQLKVSYTPFGTLLAPGGEG